MHLEFSAAFPIWNAKVNKIILEGKRVAGVMLENGEPLLADNIVAAISARQTFKELISAHVVPPGYVRKLDAAPISHF